MIWSDVVYMGHPGDDMLHRFEKDKTEGRQTNRKNLEIAQGGIKQV